MLLVTGRWFRGFSSAAPMTIDSTSASLLERLKVPGQKEAWNRFVELYGPFLHEWARRLGAQPQDAADLVQEVFVVVLRRSCQELNGLLDRGLAHDKCIPLPIR